MHTISFQTFFIWAFKIIVEHAVKLLNTLKHSLQQNMLCFFSDEKRFQIMNSPNNHWLAVSPQDVLIAMKTTYPVHIMVFGVIASDSDIMPPFIFLYGLRLNWETYIKCLEEVVLTWIERVAAKDPMSNNRTLCHISRRT